MFEGKVNTPIIDPRELEAMGYKLVIYPLSLIGVSIRAMQVRYLNFFSLFFSCVCACIKFYPN